MKLSSRASTVLAVVAIVVAGLVVRDAGGDDEADEAPRSVAPSPTNGQSDAPLSDVSIETFCAAFFAMATAHSQYLSDGTTASLETVTEAGENVLDLGRRAPMPPLANQGLTDLVYGVIGKPLEEPASEPAADALNEFLTVACPPSA